MLIGSLRCRPASLRKPTAWLESRRPPYEQNPLKCVTTRLTAHDGIKGVQRHSNDRISWRLADPCRYTTTGFPKPIAWVMVPDDSPTVGYRKLMTKSLEWPLEIGRRQPALLNHEIRHATLFHGTANLSRMLHLPKIQCLNRGTRSRISDKRMNGLFDALCRSDKTKAHHCQLI